MRGSRLDLALILAVALTTNFAYFFASNGDFYYPDSFTYLTPARSMLQGLGFLDETQTADTLRTPGYPLLLALFGAHTKPVVILQHLFNAALAGGIYLLVRRRISRPAAWMASMLFAIDTPAIHYANKVLTETTFAVLLFAAFVLALLRPRPVLLGLLCGVMVLVRPIAIAYFAILALFLAARGTPVRQIAVFVAASLVLPVGWGARNAVRTGVFTVSSVAGNNMLTYRAAGALAIEDDGDFRHDITDEQNGLIEDADDQIQQILHVPDAQDLPDSVRARYYSRFALRVIAAHPGAFAELTLRGVLVNLLDSDWDAMSEVSRFYPTIVELTVGLLPAIVLVFAVIGILALWRNDRPLALLIALTVGYFVFISAGGEAESRFRVPVIPQMAIAAAVGIETVRRAAAPAPR